MPAARPPWVSGMARRPWPMSPGISTRLLATQSDQRLLALAREGHERAFEALVLRYRRALLAYCRRLSLPEARVEDVLQQALLKTWIALRDGAEVRDIKAWLYRVVHNTAINAVRDAARERDRLADPTLRVGVSPGDLERGLIVREALSEVAALPELQREVIVRTAVGGHSHEQVASDLGITDGAVRGLLYRARATLRTAATALTPPPLLGWIAGRAQQASSSAPVPAPEALGGLAVGGGAAGFGGLSGGLGGGVGGLLVKGGAVALTAGTLITGAVVHLQGSTPRHAPAPELVASARDSGATSEATAGRRIRPVGATADPGARAGGAARRRGRHAEASGKPAARSDAPRLVKTYIAKHPATQAPGATPESATPAPTHTTLTYTRTSTPGTPSGGAGEATPAGQGTAATGSSSPTGSTANSGTPSGESASGSGASEAAKPTGGSGEKSGSTSPAGGSSGSGSGSSGSSPSGSESGSGDGSGSGSGANGSGEPQSASGSEGGLVGAVVHEVGGVLEKVLR